MAGLNAARNVLGCDPVMLGRADAYIGVLVDDLVTRGVTEPYRMFTSRAEYRLTLRADNADQRLTPLAAQLGLVDDERRRVFDAKIDALDRGRAILNTHQFPPRQVAELGIIINQDGQRRTGMEILAFADVNVAQLVPLMEGLGELPLAVQTQLETEALYKTYVERQQRDAEALKRDENLFIPQTLAYGEIGGLSNELRVKLERIRPQTLGQASRIDGMTPAALALVLARIRHDERLRA
jgi:tRNA uridine 5-carboxymethylaminomethyl modification enzyme